MKDKIREVVSESTRKLLDKYNLQELEADFEIEIPKNEKFGDFSTNAAMVLSGRLSKPPREVAQELVDFISDSENSMFRNVDIAGPGFINFYVRKDAVTSRLKEIIAAGEQWGSSDVGQGKKVLIEFVSANPTGYLHFGHGRNAVVGDTISRILRFSGFDVTNEFYINDAGRQMDLLGESVLCRYRQLLGTECDMPEGGYQGEYVSEIALELRDRYGDDLADKPDSIKICMDFAYRKLLEEIKKDLQDIGVSFQNWYSEREKIHDADKFREIREILESKDALAERDGAVWFLATEYGDNQDWVLVKKDGTPTYFFADIAYHYDKFKRGYDRIINIWGADHHSHFNRLVSSLKALGMDENRLEVVLIQFVRLVKDGVEISMSKRAGSYVTLREVAEEVGKDVTRFFLLMRSSDSHMDFDLALAKSESSENPVYYIQYAHARIMSIFRKAAEEGIEASEDNLNLLTLGEELEISKKLFLFRDVVKSSAFQSSPHKITYYLQDLASDFHIYYNKHKIVGEEKALSSARLYFIDCIRQVLRNGLNLLGVSSPTRM